MGLSGICSGAFVALLGAWLPACIEGGAAAEKAAPVFSIEVDVAGEAIEALESRRVLALEPDQRRAQRGAWRLERLLGERSEGVLVLRGAGRGRTTFSQPFAPVGGRELFVVVDGAERWTIARLAADDPLADLEKREKMVRIWRATSISLGGEKLVVDEGPGEPSAEMRAALLEVEIDGESQALSLAELERLSDTSATARGLNLSLRELLTELGVEEVGTVVVRSSKGKERLLTSGDLKQADRRPTLRLNRRGLFKLGFMADGAMLIGAKGLRRVSAVIVTSANE